MAIEQRRYPVDEPDAAVLSPLRHWAAKHLDAWAVPEAARDDILLVASELATNSLRHARTAFVCSLVHEAGEVRVQVFDRDTRLPVQARADGNATSGRGLQIVAAVADAWGTSTDVEGDIEGKVVWAHFEARPAG